MQISLLQIMFLILCMESASLFAQTCVSHRVEYGYADFTYDEHAYPRITAEKSQHKLWWHDGTWWGVLWSAPQTGYRIHRFDRNAQCWIDVGPFVDDRDHTLVDVLSDGNHLFVASHVRSRTTSGPARLYQFEYDAVQQAYAPVDGFPVEIGAGNTRFLSLAREASGRMWAVWTRRDTILLNRSLTSARFWGRPFLLKTNGVALSPEDIVQLVAFENSYIGLMWSNQNEEAFYFAYHRAGDPDTVWSSAETVFADTTLGAVADNHLNAKVYEGELYAVAKTGLENPDEPLIVLLHRTRGGTWRRYTVWQVKDETTRPILLIDEEHGMLYIFAAKHPGRLYMKRTHLNRIQFDPGIGELVLSSSEHPKLSSPTSTRQSVNSRTGILVLTSDHTTRTYLHTYLPISRRP